MVIGPFSLLVIAALVLLFFGASRLGDVGRGLGQGVRAFKKGMQREDDDDEAPRAPKVRQLEPDPDDDADEDEGVPMRRRIAAKIAPRDTRRGETSAKKLAEKTDSEEEDERS